jgi:hypothetical protein
MDNFYSWLMLPPALGINQDDLSRVVPDRMYESIPITRFADKLIQTAPVQRLKHVSHLGLMPGMAPFNACASKLEHTIGTYYLVLLVTMYPPLRQYRNLLITAAFAHDIGSPCFTHSAEPAMRRIMGCDHESIVAKRFRNSDFHNVLKGERIEFDEVIALLMGAHRDRILSQLIHGTLDLDTLDGTCRYGLMWQPIHSGLPYNPRVLVHYYAVENDELVIRDMEDKLCIAEHELFKFTTTRLNVFSQIHDPVIEAPQVMLERALHFATEKGELTKKFFWLSDEAAINFLLGKERNAQTRNLILAACRDQPYVCVEEYLWQSLTDDPTQRVAYLPLIPAVTHQVITALGARQAIADEICRRTSIQPDQVCVPVGVQKICKDLRGLKMLTNDGQPMHLLGPSVNPRFGKVYLHPDLAQSASVVNKVKAAFAAILRGQ